MRFLPVASLALLLTASCAGGASTPASPEETHLHTAVNPAAPFDRYRTFSLGPAEGPPSGYQGSAQTAEIRRRAQALVAAALTRKGYTAATGKGDLVVMVGSGRRDVAVPEGASSVSAEWQPDDEDADFVEGAIVIDAFDATSGVRVWHGSSRGAIDPAHPDDGRLDGAVQALITAFPPPKT